MDPLILSLGARKTWSQIPRRELCVGGWIYLRKGLDAET